MTASGTGGAVFIAAGLYQLTLLKDLCLSKCRTPITFIMTSWRDGISGALRMGLLHGTYCLGCCWLLFVLLFPLGIMNIAAMAVITLLIFAEKTLPWGYRATRTIGALIVIGAAAAGALYYAYPVQMATYAGMTRNYFISLVAPAGTVIPYSITVGNAAALEKLLSFLFWGAGVFVLPVIAVYTAVVYWLFRGKLRKGYG
jgi:predicted metal-binding integral membrane protein DUF2182